MIWYAKIVKQSETVVEVGVRKRHAGFAACFTAPSSQFSHQLFTGIAQPSSNFSHFIFVYPSVFIQKAPGTGHFLETPFLSNIPAPG